MRADTDERDRIVGETELYVLTNASAETWKVVRGAGQYARISGAGRGTTVWFEPNDHWSSRYQGFLTTS